MNPSFVTGEQLAMMEQYGKWAEYAEPEEFARLRSLEEPLAPLRLALESVTEEYDQNTPYKSPLAGMRAVISALHEKNKAFHSQNSSLFKTRTALEAVRRAIEENPSRSGTSSQQPLIAVMAARKYIETHLARAANDTGFKQLSANISIFRKTLKEMKDKAIKDNRRTAPHLDLLKEQLRDSLIYRTDSQQNISNDIKPLLDIISDGREAASSLNEEAEKVEENKKKELPPKTKEGEAVTPELLQESLNNLSTQLSLDRNVELEDAISRIVEYIKKINSKPIALIITFIIATFLMDVLSSIAGNYATKAIERMPQSPEIYVRNSITERVKVLEIPLETTRDYRFVSVKTLNVRSKNRKDSRALGKLHLGQVVRVVKSGRSWTLIEWRDEENEAMVKGWVFSRYLGRIDSGGKRKKR